MENIIKWQTGTPNYNGTYLITYKYFGYNPRYVTVAVREDNSWYNTDYDILRVDVLAWYPVAIIKPYEKQKMGKIKKFIKKPLRIVLKKLNLN